MAHCRGGRGPARSDPTGVAFGKPVVPWHLAVLGPPPGVDRFSSTSRFGSSTIFPFMDFCSRRAGDEGQVESGHYAKRHEEPAGLGCLNSNG